MGKGLMQAILDNAGFVAVCLLTAGALLGVAYLFEKAAKKRSGSTDRVLATRKVVMIGMFSALAGILYCFDFGWPFSPAFYKMDFSELPALIAGFAFGPVAGVMVEFLKQVVKILIKSTSTAFVGDLANFLVGSMLVLPASVIYRFHKSRTTAIIGCVAGVLCMTVFGTWFNAVYLLPTFATLYGMPLDAILGMGAAINSNVTNIYTFVLLMVAPLNLVKGSMISLLTMLIYKRVSPIIKYGSSLDKESAKGSMK